MKLIALFHNVTCKSIVTAHWFVFALILIGLATRIAIQIGISTITRFTRSTRGVDLSCQSSGFNISSS